MGPLFLPVNARIISVMVKSCSMSSQATTISKKRSLLGVGVLPFKKIIFPFTSFEFHSVFSHPHKKFVRETKFLAPARVPLSTHLFVLVFCFLRH